MSNVNPTPSQVLAALRDHGVDVQTYKGWDTVGRPWKGPDGSPGLTGGIAHHTAASSASISNPVPALGWCATAFDLPACNMIVGKIPGTSYLLAGGSVYHCGDGGPVPALGIPERGYLGQTRLFGIEIDDPGLKVGTITDYQIENVSRTFAALAELCGWDIDKSILTHGCYTNGCHGANPNGPSPCLGRKNDTLEGAWSQYPGSDKPEPYNAPWWRENVKRFSKPVATWDGTIPFRSIAARAFQTGEKNKAAWRLACRLHDLGFRPDPAKPNGEQPYPTAAVKKARMSFGWSAGDGSPSEKLWIRVFGKDKP